MPAIRPTDLARIAAETEKRKKSFKSRLMLCSGTGCNSAGARGIRAALEAEIGKRGLDKQVQVVTTGCNGFCAQGPILVVQPEGTFYKLLTEKEVAPLVEEHLVKGRPYQKLLFTPPGEAGPVPLMKDIAFFAKQQLIALRNRGLVDPESIDDYISRDGYAGLAKVLGKMKPEEALEEIKASGLRGRGGAGFPTGRKWEICRNEVVRQKAPGYVICNADEGDPGAFMDRSILECDPHSVIEGMIIGAYAIGAERGYVYARAEYPLAIERMHKAIAQARQCGLLGGSVFGTGFSFDVEIKRGAGAFVCGEETALIASIEGKRGMPRPRPPFPAQSGLWGKPTNINNVETWATVPTIMREGAKWFAGIGTEKSKGTKVFSLVGKVENTGLVEVPMGISLRSIVFDIGGGIPDGKAFKAVQTGGPSGGCIPESMLDIPVDYESLPQAGSIMGSGGMVVMDEDSCMVDIARYFLEFTQSESCGKCVPCRVGTRQMLTILERICAGKGEEGDIQNLESLAAEVKAGSLCGLGQTAPNPVLTTLRYFRDEYDAHVSKKQCPSFMCPALTNYAIDAERCIGCGACKRACPVGAITGEPKKLHVIDRNKCIKCGSCLASCPKPAAAVYRTSGELKKMERQQKKPAAKGA